MTQKPKNFTKEELLQRKRDLLKNARNNVRQAKKSAEVLNIPSEERKMTPCFQITEEAEHHRNSMIHI